MMKCFQNRRIRCLLFWVLLLSVQESQSQQVSITLNADYETIVNDFVFTPGELSISKFAKAIKLDYKTKRVKRPNIRFYQYSFTKKGLLLTCSSWKKPIDECMSLQVFYNGKNEDKNYGGSLTVLGKEISKSTSFDDLYYSQEFEGLIDKSFYADPQKPSKSELRLRYKHNSIKFIFDLKGETLEEVDISIFYIDSQFNTQKS